MTNCLKHLLILFLFICQQITAQHDSLFLFNEFTASVNRTNIKDNNTEDRVGFGLGAYHSSKGKKIISTLVGIEFNRTSQFKYQESGGHFLSYDSITYHLNTFSLPFALRFSFGKKVKVFAEVGVYLDISVFGRRIGKKYDYPPFPTQGGGTAESNEPYAFGFNYGPTLGVGIITPFFKRELLIKVEYKKGYKESEQGYESMRNSYARFVIGWRI